MIDKSGLFRVGDILLLANKIRVNSIDGFTWFSSINGLSLFHKQNWIVLLDGHRLGINIFDFVNINSSSIKDFSKWGFSEARVFAFVELNSGKYDTSPKR